MNTDPYTGAPPPTSPAVERRRRLRALAEREPATWTDAELVEFLTDRYAEPVIPPCRVCGGALSCVASGGGAPTRYACRGREEGGPEPEAGQGRPVDSMHYEDSVFLDYSRGGDDAVMEALRRLAESRRQYTEDMERNDREHESTRIWLEGRVEKIAKAGVEALQAAGALQEETYSATDGALDVEETVPDYVALRTAARASKERFDDLVAPKDGGA